MESNSLIAQTWQELNKKLEIKTSKILVRTEKLKDKIGSIFLPPKQSSFYGRIQGQYVWCTATVIAVGPEATVLPGESIMFTRLAFANMYKMQDNSYVGLVDEENVDLVFDEASRVEDVGSHHK